MNALSLSEEDRLPLHKLVYEKLKESIMTGVLEPGEKLIENQISKQMHISKTPIREAIRELAQEGLVIHHSRRGISVIDFEEDDIEEITVLRAELEGLAIRIAIQKMTSNDYLIMEKIIEELHSCNSRKDFAGIAEKDLEFHRYIIEKSENGRLIKAWNTISSQMQVLLLMLDFYSLSEDYSVKAHKDLLKTIEEGNAVKASGFIREHVLLSKENILKVYRQMSR